MITPERLPWLLSPLALLVGLLLGLLLRGCGTIDRPVKVYSDSGKTAGRLHSIDDNTVRLDHTELPLDSVSRIDFLEEEDEKSSKRKSLSEHEKKFVGRYGLKVASYKGKLVLYGKKNGNLGGYVQFTNWGSGKREYLQSVRVRKGKITFKRSCKGKQCSKLGTSPFSQEFQGKRDGRSISGEFTGTRSSGRWWAKR